MMNYNDGKWHGWNGGECPVHPETVVEVRLRDVSEEWDGVEGKSETLSWVHDDDTATDIIAFRVVKEHKEPREFWVTRMTLFDLDGNVSGSSFQETSEKDGEFKVREVIE